MQALSAREGVLAVIVLGRDGLTIDAQAGNGVDPDGLAALVPPVVDACGNLGTAVGGGEFDTGLVEFERGLALVAGLTPDTALAILVRPGVNVGSLLYEFRRHRPAIAGLL